MLLLSCDSIKEDGVGVVIVSVEDLCDIDGYLVGELFVEFFVFVDEVEVFEDGL